MSNCSPCRSSEYGGGVYVPWRPAGVPEGIQGAPWDVHSLPRQEGAATISKPHLKGPHQYCHKDCLRHGIPCREKGTERTLPLLTTKPHLLLLLRWYMDLCVLATF